MTPVRSQAATASAHVVQLFQQPQVDPNGIAERIQQSFVVPLLPYPIPFGRKSGGGNGNCGSMREPEPGIHTDPSHPRVSQTSIGHGEESTDFLGGHGNGLQPTVFAPLGERQGEALRSNRLEGGQE